MSPQVAIIGGGEIGQAIKALLVPGSLIGILDKEASRSTLAEPAELAGALVVFVGVPSQFIRAALSEYLPHLKPEAIVVALTKGLEQGSNKLVPEILAEVLPGRPWALLAGPMIAEEILAGRHTAALVAAGPGASADLISAVLDQTKIKLTTTSEIKALALLSALKNIYAIGFGLLAGLEAGTNTQAVFTTAALKEMVKILELEQAPTLLAYDLPGLGDLLATGLSPGSLNRQVGLALARGETPPVSEGVHAIKYLHARLDDQTASLPLFTALQQIITAGADPRSLIETLYHE